MIEKMLYLSFNLVYMVTALVVNDSVQNRHYGYIEIMYDPMFYIILISGIGIALLTDEKDPNVEVKKPVRYFLFSFLASVMLSALAIVFKVETQVDWFYFYCLIGATTTLSPAIVRKLVHLGPARIVDVLLEAVPEFFKWGANKFNTKNRNDE